MLIDTKKNRYTIIKELGLLVNREISGEYDFLKPASLGDEEEQLIIDSLRRDISDDEVEEIVSNVSNLVLGLTEKCNLRCSYCFYSGIYKNQKKHSVATMSSDTAKKAVDLFFKFIRQPYRKTVIRDLAVGFYGGEPLLELPLIESMVRYISRESRRLGLDKKFNITPSISSNGVLLNDTVVDFLIKNDVSVAISIDGPEPEHNKFRMSSDHKGSWKVIMDNLYRFKKRYPEFYDRQVTFLCTIHPMHDKKAIDEFFLSHRELFNLDKITFSNVRLDNLDDSILNDISAQRDDTSISTLQFEKNGAKLFAPGKFKLNRLTPKVKLTGTCFPGDRKIFVSSNGDVHLCETIAECLPIGNVSKGLYFDRVRKIVREFNEEIIKNKCWKCDVWFLCNACYATALQGERFDIDCPKDQISASIKQRLEYLEKKHEEELRDLSINSVDDYLDFLR